MKRQVLSCEPILAFNLLVSLFERTSKDFELISKSAELIELKVFFGDSWNGKKTIKCKIIKTNSGESEVYLNAYAINPISSGEGPVNILQKKSVEKYLTEIANYLQTISTQGKNRDINYTKSETESNSNESLKYLIDLDNREKTKNRKVKFFALIMGIFFLVFLFINASGPSACECVDVLGDAYNRGLFWKESMNKDELARVKDCMNKFDGKVNAEKECNSKAEDNVHSDLPNRKKYYMLGNANNSFITRETEIDTQLVPKSNDSRILNSPDFNSLHPRWMPPAHIGLASTFIAKKELITNDGNKYFQGDLIGPRGDLTENCYVIVDEWTYVELINYDDVLGINSGEAKKR